VGDVNARRLTCVATISICGMDISKFEEISVRHGLSFGTLLAGLMLIGCGDKAPKSSDAATQTTTNTQNSNDSAPQATDNEMGQFLAQCYGTILFVSVVDPTADEDNLKARAKAWANTVYSAAVPRYISKEEFSAESTREMLAISSKKKGDMREYMISKVELCTKLLGPI
jgi:hypothetical protein